MLEYCANLNLSYQTEMWPILWERRTLATQPYEVVLAQVPKSLFLKKCPAKVPVLKHLELLTNAVTNLFNRAWKESDDPDTSEVSYILQRVSVLGCPRVIFRWRFGFSAKALRLFRARLYGIYRDIFRHQGLD